MHRHSEYCFRIPCKVMHFGKSHLLKGLKRSHTANRLPCFKVAFLAYLMLLHLVLYYIVNGESRLTVFYVRNFSCSAGFCLSCNAQDMCTMQPCPRGATQGLGAACWPKTGGQRVYSHAQLVQRHTCTRPHFITHISKGNSCNIKCSWTKGGAWG